jgi:hypothetical protein
MPSDRPPGDAPGLKIRRNVKGEIIRRLWVPPQAALDLGYVRSIRIHDEDAAAIASRCRLLQAEMLEWLAQKREASHPGAGVTTIAALIRQYVTRDASPYKSVKWNTRRVYTQVLNRIDRDIGQVNLASIRLDDFVRWFNTARFPEGKGAGKPDYLRSAAGVIAMLRRIIAFGVAIEVRECERLATILSHYEFKAPKRRSVALMMEHVQAFIATAREQNRLSLALATALQFETTLRQKDVIGEWEPIAEATHRSQYVIGKHQWANGLTWAHISPKMILSKATTKSGEQTVVTFDLTLMPLVLDVLADIPEPRVGPLIIDENTGRPYTNFAREWRVIADMAGIPRSVRNMDARAGGLTEAGEAGASLSDARRTAGHKDERTTAGYIRGTALEPTRRVSNLRLVHRQKKGEVA